MKGGQANARIEKKGQHLIKAVGYAQCTLFLIYPSHYALVLHVQVYELLTVQRFPTEHKIVVTSKFRIMHSLI
jgi:hypothetical protein